MGAALNTAQVHPGATVAIIGCGGVGISVLQGARIAGASRIIAVDQGTEKKAAAEQQGATDYVDSKQGDPVAQVQALTGGRGVDYAFEVIGLADTVTQAVRALRAGGTAVAIGIAARSAAAQVNLLDLVTQEKTLRGSIYGSTRPAADFPRLFELYRRGRLPLDRLLSREWPLEQINEAYDALLAGTVARSVVVP